MLFSTVLVLSAAAAGVIAAPVAQAGTTAVAAATTAAAPAVSAAVVSAAGWNGGNRKTTTTTTTKKTTTKSTTTSAVPTTTKSTTTVSTTTATPTPSRLPLCQNRQQFNIKARGLEDYSGNRLPSVAIGQFVVDIGGPMGFSAAPSTEYFLDQSGFLTQTGTGLIATVKTVEGGTPHIGNIVFLRPDQSIALNYSPLRCSGDQAGTLGCLANNGNRKVLQVCGRFIDFEAQQNANCQDKIAFDVVKTCEFR